MGNNGEEEEPDLPIDTVTIFQISVTFKMLWPLATKNYGGLPATNSLYETSQVLWPLFASNCVVLRPQT